jgi:hypothetical protein
MRHGPRGVHPLVQSRERGRLVHPAHLCSPVFSSCSSPPGGRRASFTTRYSALGHHAHERPAVAGEWRASPAQRQHSSAHGWRRLECKPSGGRAPACYESSCSPFYAGCPLSGAHPMHAEARPQMHRMVVRVCRRVRHRASVIVSIHVCSILYMVFVCESADIAKECESEAKQDAPWTPTQNSTISRVPPTRTPSRCLRRDRASP